MKSKCHPVKLTHNLWFFTQADCRKPSYSASQPPNSNVAAGLWSMQLHFPKLIQFSNTNYRGSAGWGRETKSLIRKICWIWQQLHCLSQVFLIFRDGFKLKGSCSKNVCGIKISDTLPCDWKFMILQSTSLRIIDYGSFLGKLLFDFAPLKNLFYNFSMRM